jgi:prephenate dehydrogenase
MRKFIFKKISIIGVGLIGGSIGLAVKKCKLADEVMGLTSRQITLKKALKSKAIDRGSLNLKETVKDADLVILAVPVNKISAILKSISPHLKQGCLVTDIASTKEEIVKIAESTLPKSVFFVGTHPMAGSEKRGVDFAEANLFNNSVLIITPTSKTDKKSLDKIRQFWRKLGARVISLSPKKHDGIVASVSHLPHAIAVSLMNAVSSVDCKFAAGGFKDVTRIAKSSEVIWDGIFTSNKREIVKKIDFFIKELNDFKTALKKTDNDKIRRKLKQARKKRGQI